MRLGSPASWSLGIKFPLTITAIVAGVGFTIGTIIVAQNWVRFEHNLQEKALLLAQAAAATTDQAVLNDDYWAIYKDLRRLASESRERAEGAVILTAMVLDPEGLVLSHLDPENHPIGLPLALAGESEKRLFKRAMAASGPITMNGPSGRFVEGVVPVRSDEKLLAVVRLRLSTAGIYSQLQRSALTVLGVTGVLVILGSLLGAIISRRMVYPLAELARGMDSMHQGHMSEVSPVHIVDRDEIGDLAASFNRMTAELMEKEALEQELAVNEKLAAVGRIVAGVAHEVNNPLAGMLNCIDTMKKHPERPDLTARYLPLLEKGLNRIGGIVSGLLGELRVEGASEMAGPPCLDDIRDLVVAEIEDEDIDFQWHNDLEPEVLVHRQQVQQVILNLIKNAVKAVSGEPGRGRVCFRAYHQSTCIVLEVEDDGPGISEKDQSRLFDPFFTTSASGTGLGLWITYRLVKSLDGSIEVRSNGDDGGTSFFVYLWAKDEIGDEEMLA